MAIAPGHEEQSVTLVRTIAAPLSRVFTAWTDPSLLQQWLAPTFCRIVEMTADARTGGAFRMVIRGPFGGRHVITGEYHEVTPGRRLVQTWVAEGHSRTIDRYETLLTVEFREVGEGSTEITLRQDRLLTRADRSGNLMGWKLCLGKLEKVLRRTGARDQPRAAHVT